jgi:hypothetical protein
MQRLDDCFLQFNVAELTIPHGDQPHLRDPLVATSGIASAASGGPALAA